MPEARHIMNTASFMPYASFCIVQHKITGIRPKLVRSLEFLGIDKSKVTVYVAGNHWVDEDTIREARTIYRFGCSGPQWF
jgi:hypothetical protein